ncbi:TetR/AcrR family transcriptional regulator [Leucobacter soli]|uniref:HTH-type transcriptional regulator BetI n=1 Tax=Leucobacter soli TaxID=2812850 RepID=A0A916JUW1_9MICO|nr:TetR/AcrR family transcriptional regulator [Leucobacter soli]CAG7604907.1 HTH-type transcriptional regulator BetI [Leucobacter soli]
MPIETTPTPESPPAQDTGDEIDLATRRRAEILCGTIRVIARDGIVAAKLKDIARESGVSLGLIQHYFDTREKLVDAAFAAMMQVISNSTSERLDAVTDPLQVIYEAARLHVFGTVSFPERWGFWSELWAAAGRSDHMRGVAKRIYELWALPLERSMIQLTEQGRLPEGANPATLTIGLLALMDGLAVRTLAEPEIFTTELMLQILNDWTTTQLGVDPLEAAAVLDRIAHEPDSPAADLLTPGVVAAALLHAQDDATA